MSIEAESPLLSSSSDDFAAVVEAVLEIESNASTASSNDNFPSLLDAILDTDANASADPEGISKQDMHSNDSDRDDCQSMHSWVKRRRVELSQGIVDPQSSSFAEPTLSGSSYKKNTCHHPLARKKMCLLCGKILDENFGVPFGYMGKELRLADDEIARIRSRDLKNVVRRRKLYLVLDLDHTLLNSTRLSDLTLDEEYLLGRKDDLPENLNSTLYRVEGMMLMTKLRPFVHTFLEEANKLFEMYIYTMGDRPYALEMAKLLDPGHKYFDSRVIAKQDCTKRLQKDLDVILGQESAVVVLDDTEEVWQMGKDNLILMERYNFFASSCKKQVNCKSLSELRRDESETDGALATVLKILRRVHYLVFDEGQSSSPADVREVLKKVRKEVLKGCRVVFSGLFPCNDPAEQQHLWKMAEKLGATCSTEPDESVTHVISVNAGTAKSRWAVKEKKFLVNPGWIEASNFLWRKQPEENFPIMAAKHKSSI